MLKTIVVLPDGTELSSGVGTANALKSVTITECVNDAQQLALGSTCANMIELTAITPNGGFSIAEGDEITVYRQDDAGIRHKVGLFTAEKPTRASAHSLKVTAYDRVSWLDKDLTAWVAGLTDWPYPMYDFAKMTCRQCGLELLNTEIPNGEYLVQRFSADGITGRQIMKWIGEVAGRFCRATVDGQIEFAWYQPVNASIDSQKPSVTWSKGHTDVYSPGVTVESDDDGNVTLNGEGITVIDDGEGNVSITISGDEAVQVYYQSGLSFADYQVEPIKKVQIKGSEDDVGVIYPEDLLEAVNTYVISGNYLLTATETIDWEDVAKTLYEQLKDVTYTPCKVVIPAGFQIHAGDIIRIRDKNGVTFTTYVMTKKQSGQRDTLECTGSARRDSSAAINAQSYAALSGKVLNLKMNVEGLRLEHKNTEGELASLSLNLEGITTQVQNQEESIEGLSQDITQIRQDAESVNITVQSILDNGVSKVETETGYTFGKDGLHISRSDSDIENRLDETGMYVSRSGDVLLQANEDGVTAVDVTVRNYLVVGNHARFEDYKNGTDTNRTACFWL